MHQFFQFFFHKKRNFLEFVHCWLDMTEGLDRAVQYFKHIAINN